jgi:cytoskeletal protein RodZ
MPPFILKKVQKKDSVGLILKQARERLGLSLENIASQIDIKSDYLSFIEDGCWNELPGECYLVVFIKKYSSALGIKWEKIQKGFEEEKKKFKFIEIKNYSDGNKNINISAPKIARQAIIFVVLFFLVAYISSQIWNTVSSPKLVILNPSEERTAQNSQFINIVGETDKNAKVWINGVEILPDTEGFFSSTVDLSSDLNIIKVEAKKKYSRSAIVVRNVMYNKN